MAYVYRHIRLDKNEPFYIGIGNDDGGKYKRAYSSNRKTSIIWNRIAAKTNYEVEILIDGLSWQEAIKKEIEFIKLYGRMNLGTGTLANMTDGGQGNVGIVLTPEVRYKYGKTWRGKKQPEELNIKRRNAQIGKFVSIETRRKISKANKGRTITEEMKKHLSEINRGKKLSSETKAKIKFTKSQRTYEYKGRKKSQEEIEKIRKHLWGHKRNLGYKHTDEAKMNMKKSCTQKKSVLQYSLGGTFIKEYCSQREAQFNTGIPKEAIGRACKGVYRGYKNHICNGFKWYYQNTTNENI